MSPEEIENWKRKIDQMNLEDCARLWRFSVSGHPIFDCNLPLFSHFNNRFQSLGGWNPALSKKIGWENRPTYIIVL
jgi:hypothetical protein